MFGYGSCLRVPQKGVLFQLFPNFLRWAPASAASTNPSNRVLTSSRATFCVPLMKRSSFKSRTRTWNCAGPWWVTNTRKSSHKSLYTKPPKIFSASALSTYTGTTFSALVTLCNVSNQLKKFEDSSCAFGDLYDRAKCNAASWVEPAQPTCNVG